MAKKAQHGGKREGSGRKPKPRGEKLKPIAIAVPPELLVAIDKHATVAGESRSAFMVRMIKAGMAKRS